MSVLRERRARPRRVLLIDDSGLRMMLELAGHVVFAAADGVRGLELRENAEAFQRISP